MDERPRRATSESETVRRQVAPHREKRTGIVLTAKVNVNAMAVIEV